MGQNGLTLVENWILLEADFQREYGLDLNREIGRMSWRRFCALVAGLSEGSAFRAVASEGGALRPKPVVLEGEAAARHIRAWLQ